MGNKVLVIIDMQNDFIDGVLGTPEAQAIVKPMTEFINNWDGDDIVFTYDTHYDKEYLNTVEGKHLPIKHCIMYTPGHDISKPIYKAITERAEKYLNNNEINRVYSTHKSAFAEIDLYPICTIGNNVEFCFCGVCTDICVIANAIVLKAQHPDAEITVIEDLCAGTTPKMHQKAIDVMRSLHINIKKAAEY